MPVQGLNLNLQYLIRKAKKVGGCEDGTSVKDNGQPKPEQRPNCPSTII